MTMSDEQRHKTGSAWTRGLCAEVGDFARFDKAGRLRQGPPRAREHRRQANAKPQIIESLRDLTPADTQPAAGGVARPVARPQSGEVVAFWPCLPRLCGCCADKQRRCSLLLRMANVYR